MNLAKDSSLPEQVRSDLQLNFTFSLAQNLTNLFLKVIYYYLGHLLIYF